MPTNTKKATTRRAPAKPNVPDLKGRMGREIAEMIASGDVSQSGAEAFVAQRAVARLHKEQAKLDS